MTSCWDEEDVHECKTEMTEDGVRKTVVERQVREDKNASADLCRCVVMGTDVLLVVLDARRSSSGAWWRQ